MSKFTNKRKYDLEERTAKLAENIIDLARKIKITPINSRIISQLVGSGGSIGANYCETNELLLIFSKIIMSNRSKDN